MAILTVLLNALLLAYGYGELKAHVDAMEKQLDRMELRLDSLHKGP